MLERNTCLTSLNIFYNDVGDEGAKALATAMKRNHSLPNPTPTPRHNQVRGESSLPMDSSAACATNH